MSKGEKMIGFMKRSAEVNIRLALLLLCCTSGFHGGNAAEPVVIEDLGMELIPIPAGSFLIGSPTREKDRLDNEGPQTEVTLTEDFWLGKTEVTQRQWEAIMGNNPSRFKGENRPVESVTWEVAMEFCRRLTAREQAAGKLPFLHKYTLPTEAQWEYACSAGTTTRFSFGDDPDFDGIDEHAWYFENSELQTHDVGGKLANPWGLHDMHGNVVEWCSDWLTNDYPGGSVTDPIGPQSGLERVFRGGGWGNAAWHNRTAERGGDLPEIGWERHGLRVALVAEQERAGGADAPAIETVIVEGIGLELVSIPSGTFTMGSPGDEKGRQGDEGPQPEVTLNRAFWLGRTEVTQRQWEAIMGNNPSGFKGSNRPVESVTWNDAMDFCRRLTERERTAGRMDDWHEYTLPTEAQWEYACRAGTTARFSYGDDPDFEGLGDYAWYIGNGSARTHNVEGRLANPWGLQDMHGNVLEWCEDWYSRGYTGGNAIDPQGAKSGSARVLRGGGWNSSAAYCRSSVRGWSAPGSSRNDFGFRVARVAVTDPRRIVDIGMDLVPIPAGTFTMGSPNDEVGRGSNEGPQTEVTLTQNFWLGKTEVTRGQWEAIMEGNSSSFKGANLPLNKAGWGAAMEFCRKLTKRERAAGRQDESLEYTLPTEAQWEYACRAGTTTRFSYGDDFGYGDLGDYAWWWHDGNRTRAPHYVGEKLANPWGLHDMHGNVVEWCLDWVSDDYPGGSVVDPSGPASGTNRVIRGGAWSSNGRLCRSANRLGNGGASTWSRPVYTVSGDVGFRVALVPVSN